MAAPQTVTTLRQLLAGHEGAGGRLPVEVIAPAPSETYGELALRVHTAHDAGVPQVWVLDAHYRTVTVYRPDGEPVMLNAAQTLDGGPELPGFRVPVARIFPL